MITHTMQKIQPKFIDPDKDKTRFFSVLRRRVDDHFKEKGISKHYNTEMVLKTVVLIVVYLLPFVCLLVLNLTVAAQMVLWFIMGLGLAGIGMSVMHDANHGAYSGSSRVNYWLGHTLNMLGGAVFNWKLQHNILHHTYTNIVHHDEDVEDKLVLRFSPHTKVKWYHKLQVFYAFLFYGILTLYWVLLKDFVQFVRFTKDGVNKNTRKQNALALAKIILFKAAYYFAFFGVPLAILKMPALPWITGFLLMHFVAGLILTITFQLAHTVEGTTHPLPDEKHTIKNNWAIHQLNTTVNFARGNKLVSWYVGGLNYQVEHHLFPTICHVHYPAVSEIVKSTCEEFGIPYLENKTLGDAVASHVRTLRRFGKLPDINEALA